MIRGSDVTIVLPTIPGRDEMRHRAILSAYKQTVPPATVVVYEDRNRIGAAGARNAAIAQVDTDVIGLLDDDDALLENHIQVLTRAMHRHNADMVFSYAEFIGGRDPLACCYRGRLVAEPISVPFGDDQRLHLDSRNREFCPACRHLTGNFIPVTYLVKTALVREVGGFPQPYSMPECRASGECEDYLLLLRMLDAGARFHHVPDVRTWRYYIHDTNTGGRGADRMHELDGA